MAGGCAPPHVLVREERPHPTDESLKQDRLVCETHGGIVGGWDWDSFNPETGRP